MSNQFPKVLGFAKPSTSGGTETFYTVPSGYTTRVSHIIVSAVTTGRVLLQHRDADADSGNGVEITLLPNRDIASRDNLEFFDIILEQNDSLKVTVSQSNDIEIIAYGIERENT